MRFFRKCRFLFVGRPQIRWTGGVSAARAKMTRCPLAQALVRKLASCSQSMTKLMEADDEAGNNQDNDKRYPEQEAKCHNPDLSASAGIKSPDPVYFAWQVRRPFSERQSADGT